MSCKHPAVRKPILEASPTYIGLHNKQGTHTGEILEASPTYIGLHNIDKQGAHTGEVELRLKELLQYGGHVS
jgi:hypothetical protein